MANRRGKGGSSDRFLLLGLQSNCRWWLKPWNQKMIAFWKGKKKKWHQDSVLKSGDITLPTKVCVVKAMIFAVVMYSCESWTAKKAECQWIDAFQLWCWRRLPKVPWTARKSNQSILREINPEYSLGRLMLKLKLQCFGHLIQTDDSLEKSLMPGKIEGRRRRRSQRMRWLDGIIDAMHMNLGKLWVMVRDMEAWHSAAHMVTRRWTWLEWLNNNNNNLPWSDGTGCHDANFLTVEF